MSPRALAAVAVLAALAGRAAGQPSPAPLATAGPATGLGILGQAGTTVVIGNSTFDFKEFSGVRLIGGLWITQSESLGIEGNLFVLPTKRIGTPPIAGSAGQPTLARP